MDFDFFLNYKIFGFLLVDILIGIIIFLSAFLLRNLITSVILKPFRIIAHKRSNETDTTLINVIEAPLKLSIVIMGTYVASQWLPFKTFDSFVLLVCKSLVTMIIFWILIRFVDKFSTIFNFFSTKLGKDLNDGIQNFIVKTLRILLIVLGTMAILQEWGINVSAFVASLGLGGLAFALAAKDTAANLFGSLVIFSDRPFQVGDWVETASAEGTIEEVGIRSTKIRTFAQALVSVPNSIMADTTITNWSRMGKRRVRTRIGLTYGTSVEQMQAIIEEITQMLKNHPDIHQEVILVSFDEFENSALSILLNFFTDTVETAEYLHVRQDVNFKIMQIVAKHGAAFAFPSHTLYVESLPK